MILTVNTRHKDVKSLRTPHHAFTAVAGREHIHKFRAGRGGRGPVGVRNQGPRIRLANYKSIFTKNKNSTYTKKYQTVKKSEKKVWFIFISIQLYTGLTKETQTPYCTC